VPRAPMGAPARTRHAPVPPLASPQSLVATVSSVAPRAPRHLPLLNHRVRCADCAEPTARAGVWDLTGGVQLDALPPGT